MPRFLLRKFEHRALGRDDLLAERRQLLIQFDIFGQNSRAVLAPARHLAGDLLAAVGHLAELVLQACQRRALAAMPFFESRQSCPQHGMFFADPLGFRLRRIQLVAHGFESQFAIGALGILLLDQRLVLRALLMRPLFFALQALQFQARHGNPRIGAIDFFRRAADIVIERNRFLLARLLQLAEPFQFRFERRGLTLQSFLIAHLCRRARAPAPTSCAAYSRISRLSTRGPLAFLRPPVSMRPL